MPGKQSLKIDVYFKIQHAAASFVRFIKRTSV